MADFTLHLGDCYEVMKSMPDNSVDSIVTDPPYELGFMGKSWDSTGIAYSAEMWAEALRVLKHGGHLLAFSGSRTYHRMAVAIEDAGFEIRDQIMWVYGSGFPKSHNISKAIDKAAGITERPIIGEKYGADRLRNQAPDGNRDGEGTWGNEVGRDPYLRGSVSPAAKQWEGWGTALKPAHEPIVLARKPLIGTVVKNVLAYGTGALNIDASRVFTDDILSIGSNNRENGSINFGMADDKLAQEQNALGRFPANFIHDGSDEVLDLFPDSKGGAYPAKRGQAVNTAFASGQETVGGFRAMGDSGSAARFFYCAKANKRDRNEGLDGFEAKQTLGGGGLTAEIKEDGSYDTASAGGKYGSVKAVSQNYHPTVKPTALMQYLVRLVTPPNGTVLDPFLGSGSTGKACMYEKFNFIGIEMTEEYLPIARARIEFAQQDKELEQDTLF